MVYVFTLDAHEFYGPFISREAAKVWADAMGMPSYGIVKHVPEYARCVVRKP